MIPLTPRLRLLLQASKALHLLEVSLISAVNRLCNNLNQLWCLLILPPRLRLKLRQSHFDPFVIRLELPILFLQPRPLPL